MYDPPRLLGEMQAMTVIDAGEAPVLVGMRPLQQRVTIRPRDGLPMRIEPR
jgi:hypothetical protein